MNVPTFPPRKDSELSVWACSFRDKLASQPNHFHITPEQLAAFSDLCETYAAAFERAKNPNTNGKAAVIAKNQARDKLLHEPGGAWELVKVIQAHPSTTDSDRGQLGLRIAAKLSRTPRPVDPPTMDILHTAGRKIKVRLRTEAQPDRRGKPDGVRGATVLYYVGEDLPADPAEWRFAMNASKPVFDVMIPASVPAGLNVWLCAFWFNDRMQASPPSLPQYTNVGPAVSKAA